MASLHSDMRWEVKYHNFNKDEIETINILRYAEDTIKEFKKKSNSKEEFDKLLDIEMMWRYWSKCEWEIIITKDNDRIYLSPWLVSRSNHTIDVTDDSSFDWKTFADLHISKQIYEFRAKIDVYDQLKFRWEEFVDYCWNYHHKWWRYKRVEQ